MTLNRTELISLMAASMCRKPDDNMYRKEAIKQAQSLLREVESLQPQAEVGDEGGDYSCATCGFGQKRPCEHWVNMIVDSTRAAALDAAIAEIVRYADECNTEDAGRYARAGLNGVRFRIEALKSKPLQAAEGEKE